MPQIDGLRGIAIIAVILSHFPPHPALAKILPLGYLGVQLFFVLSGFLITGILLSCRERIESGESTRYSVFRGFYGRRALRIFPVYYLCLVVLYLLDSGQMRSAFGYHAAYLGNFRMAWTGQSLGDTTHFWSLAVEEQFYMVWPCVVLMAPSRHLFKLMLLAALIGPLHRLVTTSMGAHTLVSFYLPFGNLDALCGGALLALVSRREAGLAKARKFLRLACVGGGLGLVATAVANFMELEFTAIGAVGLGICTSLCFVGLVDAAARGEAWWGRGLEWRPLVYVGKVSYCLYVVHYVLPELLERVCATYGWQPLTQAEHPVLRFALLSTLSLAIAALSYRYLELPLQRAKRWFPYGPRPTSVTPAADPTQSASGRAQVR